ncbi:MAG: hypothetical protein ACRCZF_11945, partial [Gemmataceae bacterium]
RRDHCANIQEKRIMRRRPKRPPEAQVPGAASGLPRPLARGNRGTYGSSTSRCMAMRMQAG